MKGYLNNEKATKHTVDEEGWLHTGDVAIVDDEDMFYIVDRLKELIKCVCCSWLCWLAGSQLVLCCLCMLRVDSDVLFFGCCVSSVFCCSLSTVLTVCCVILLSREHLCQDTATIGFSERFSI